MDTLIAIFEYGTAPLILLALGFVKARGAIKKELNRCRKVIDAK